MRTVVRFIIVAGVCWLLFFTAPGRAMTGPLADPLLDGWRLLLTTFWDDLGRLLGASA